MKKVLLLHGWNYMNYTKMTKKCDAWDNRKSFVKELEKNFDIYKLNFPGFCGEEEPKRAWDLTDFANYVYEYLKTNNLTVDYILGYSFGGAVAIFYNRMYDANQKLILISPAIVRNHNKSKKFIATPKFLQPIRNVVRKFYLIKIVKNNELVYGTKFLRDTYQNIVRIELINDLESIDPELIKIIYGSEDSMVNPNLVMSKIKDKYKKCFQVIDGGGHDIANTHTDELIKIIGK